jgi:hypothetical protein
MYKDKGKQRDKAKGMTHEGMTQGATVIPDKGPYQ